jgi:5-methylcytosine-specific restriction endonuclease McrA
VSGLFSFQVGSGTKDYIRIRDGGICVYCEDAVGQQIDHVVPIHAGGPSIRGNLVLACVKCNMKKKGKLHELMMAKAFKHLAEVGESIDWVDKLFTDS